MEEAPPVEVGGGGGGYLLAAKYVTMHRLVYKGHYRAGYCLSIRRLHR